MSLNVELLEQSFEQIKPQAGEFVSHFYTVLLNDYPQLRPMFAHTNMADQQKKLVGALALVVAHLRKPDVLLVALRGLGARHQQYGVRPEHYGMVGAALLQTFDTFLGADWTPALRQAWTDAYGVISSVMLEGEIQQQQAA